MQSANALSPNSTKLLKSQYFNLVLANALCLITSTLFKLISSKEVHFSKVYLLIFFNLLDKFTFLREEHSAKANSSSCSILAKLISVNAVQFLNAKRSIFLILDKSKFSKEAQFSNAPEPIS